VFNFDVCNILKETTQTKEEFVPTGGSSLSALLNSCKKVTQTTVVGLAGVKFVFFTAG